MLCWAAIFLPSEIATLSVIVNGFSRIKPRAVWIDNNPQVFFKAQRSAAAFARWQQRLRGGLRASRFTHCSVHCSIRRGPSGRPSRRAGVEYGAVESVFLATAFVDLLVVLSRNSDYRFTSAMKMSKSGSLTQGFQPHGNGSSVARSDLRAKRSVTIPVVSLSACRLGDVTSRVIMENVQGRTCVWTRFSP